MGSGMSCNIHGPALSPNSSLEISLGDLAAIHTGRYTLAFGWPFRASTSSAALWHHSRELRLLSSIGCFASCLLVLLGSLWLRCRPCCGLCSMLRSWRSSRTLLILSHNNKCDTLDVDRSPRSFYRAEARSLRSLYSLLLYLIVSFLPPQHSHQKCLVCEEDDLVGA